MCGIAGIIGFDGRPAEAVEVRSMCAVLAHRGPDDEGLYAGRDAALGMRRLSVIDPGTGRQPLDNEDGSVQAVCNGEIYNYRELRADLRRRGHRFRTESDAEVIVHLYEEHGARFVERMRGMFALALWDRGRRRLLLARDRLGIKPLYYATVGGRLVFASELKAILQLPDVDRRLDWGAVGHLFAFLTTPPDRSIVEGVRKLPPAHVLVATAGGAIRLERYWDLEFEPRVGRDEEALVDELRALLKESVRLHLVSDVPLGAFLSGGIDSSAVVATMARLSDSPVRTFSVGFEEEDHDELRYARLVARKFGTLHHERVVTPDVADLVEDLGWYLDEPFGDSSAIPTFVVSGLAAGTVTVALSGDGGDEIFGGYDKYLVEGRERRGEIRPALLRRAIGALAARLPEGARGRNFLRHRALTGPARYLDASTLFRTRDQKKLFMPAAFERIAREDPRQAGLARLSRTGGDWLGALQDLDLRMSLPLDILTKVDRMSMAHGLETRVPLLDHRIVEFAAGLPIDLRLRGGTTKYIFKRAMRGILPDVVIDRRKQGFAIPLGRWFRGRLGPFVHDLLLSDSSRRRGIVDPSYVRSLLRLHARGWPLDLQLWTLMSFEIWCRTFLDTRVPRRSAAPRAAAPAGSIGVAAAQARGAGTCSPAGR